MLFTLQGAGMVMSRMILKAKLEDGRQSSSLHPRMTVWSRECPFPTSKSYLGVFAGREITLYSIDKLQFGVICVSKLSIIILYFGPPWWLLW